MEKSYWIFNGKLDILVSEQLTDGQYDLIVGEFAPGVTVPPHQHNNYSESIMLTEGELTVYLKDKTTVLKPGDHIFIPKSTPHAIENTGSIMAKGLTVASPSGFARLIREVGLPGNADGSAPTTPNDLELFMRISAELGDVMLGPPGARP